MSRFIPYLQLHEFEMVLFAAPEITNEVLHGSPSQLRRLQSALKRAGGNPELINDGVPTSPSHQIAELFPEYRKVVDGPFIAEQIGCERIRACAPHFKDWICRLIS